MADELKNFADTAKLLGQQLGYNNEQMAKLVEQGKKLDESGAHMKNLADTTKKASDEASKLAGSFTPIRDEIEKARASSGFFVSALGTVAAAIYNTTNAAMDAGEQFNAAFNKSKLGEIVGGIDEVTKMSREFRGEAIRVGSEFGLGFEETAKTYQAYSGAVLLAQASTYASRQEIEQNALALAKMGISLDEMTRVTSVAGQQQNMLTEGFKLAQDSGLGEAKVFDIMATATRKMGISVEDSSRPILALQSLAKSTGLPITELSNRVFGIAEQYSRFGMSVESLSPILRRFTDVLGPGFKGLAIDDTIRLVQGLAGQVNTTNAAFMAMQSGMARPGAGVAGAMVDFEDAMAEPEKAMKMLAASLGNISGGKILTFEDAHQNEANATQFKLQRDMLTQLTGINDPQQTKTLLALLSAQQSGKALTSEENKTLAEAMRSGTAKQEEQKSLAEKIGKAQVGILAQIALDISNMATRNLSPQATSALVNRGANIATEYSAEARDKLGAVVDRGLAAANDFFAKHTPEVVKNAGQTVSNYIDESKNQIAEVPTQRISAFNPGEAALTIGGKFNVPAPVAPTPVFPTPQPSPPGAPMPMGFSKQTTGPGEKEVTNIVVTLRASDTLTKAISEGAVVTFNKTLHGNG